MFIMLFMPLLPLAIGCYEGFCFSIIDIKKELAECYHLEKNYTSAIEYYNAVLAANPDDLDIKTNKAIALHAMNDFPEAIKLYNEILEKKDSEMIQENLTDAIISQASTDLNVKNYSSAIDGYIKAISRGTKNSEAYYGLAKAYRAIGSNDKATEYYEKAIKMNPENTDYSKEFATFISETNKPQELEKPSDDGKINDVSISLPETKPAEDNSYVENIEKNKELIKLGDASYKNKKYDDAIKNYREALSLKPSDEETLLKVGNVYKLKKDETNAIDFYKKAIFVKPEYADGWFNLGLVYADQKNVAQSKQCFEKTISINPKYAYAYYALAVANESEHNKEAAVQNYEKFLEYSTDESVKSSVQARIKSLKK